MRLDEVYLRNVGPFREARIEFPRGSDPLLADIYLLTGPNGSGKSTILYSIASAIGGAAPLAGQELVSPRLRERDSVVAVKRGAFASATAWADASGAVIDNPFETSQLRLESKVGSVGFYYSANQLGISYAERVRGFPVDGPKTLRPSFDWAAFGYAGSRTFDNVHVDSIHEPKDSPFKNSLSFARAPDSWTFADWIANQQFRALRAKDAGHDDRAQTIMACISHIQRIIAEIIEDPSFTFVMNEDDNDVRVRRGRDLIELDLLPDGLKSIVSWVADLLMRLDRIPWQEDVPVLERPFLLLLDEIDIHLHPAWQRRVLPIVQRIFPNAQIIASTHSPFVVASAADAHIISLSVNDGIASVERTEPSQLGYSYSAVLRSIFGITSEFDVETQQMFERFHAAKTRLLRGDAGARDEVDHFAAALAQRSEEVRELVALELRQLQRQLASRPAS